VQLGFVSAPLRKHLLSTLPHAPKDALLTFKIEAMTYAEQGGGELWPLLTAPYWQPAAPTPTPQAPPLHPRVLAMTAPPGLLAVVYQADLPA
jgi:hypothetical protein